MQSGLWLQDPAAVRTNLQLCFCAENANVLDLPKTHRAGIGKAMATRLADQGLNIVLVAKPDDLLDTTHVELQETYPKLQFRKVPC